MPAFRAGERREHDQELPVRRRAVEALNGPRERLDPAPQHRRFEVELAV
jgi:hypothetical protein